MKTLTEIMIGSGILEESVLQEMLRWGAPLPPREESEETEAGLQVYKPELFCQAIEKAIQEEGYLLTRETDLDLIPQYIASIRNGDIHLKYEDQEGSYPTFYGMTPSGEYIIAWSKPEDITDVLTNGESFLESEGDKIYFSSLREHYYGKNKAFIVCTRSRA